MLRRKSNRSYQEIALPHACSAPCRSACQGFGHDTPSTEPHPALSRPVHRARSAGGNRTRDLVPTKNLRCQLRHCGTLAGMMGLEPTISSSTERRAGRCATRPNSRTAQFTDGPAELFSPQSLGFAIKAMNGEGSVRMAAKHIRPPPGELNEPALAPGCKGADKRKREGGSCLHLRAQIGV